MIFSSAPTHANDNRAEATPSGAVMPESLTFGGITLFGTLDLGLQNENHGAPISPYNVGGTVAFVMKYSNRSVTGVTPSNLSQSRIGLDAKEPFGSDWTALLRLETFFNPQSGEIADCLKSLTVNNGRTLANYDSGTDASIAGQPFQIAYAGVGSKRFGTLTFGRHLSLLGEGIVRYDPQVGSLAFSMLGAQGITAGGGATQDRRLDSSAKYATAIGPLRVAGLYKFSARSGEANRAVQLDAGFDFAKGSVDGFYSKITQAVAASSLTPAQFDKLAASGTGLDRTLSGSVSDNTSYGLMAKFFRGGATFFGGFEYIHFENPSHPLAPGFEDLSGYVLAYVNNAVYDHARNLRIFWSGVRYSLGPKLDLTAAYYGYRQGSYATGVNVGCSSNIVPACGGRLNSGSASVSYRLTARFDVYAGSLYSSVRGGLSSGYLQTWAVATTAGWRFRF